MCGPPTLLGLTNAPSVSLSYLDGESGARVTLQAEASNTRGGQAGQCLWEMGNGSSDLVRASPCREMLQPAAQVGFSGESRWTPRGGGNRAESPRRWKGQEFPAQSRQESPAGSAQRTHEETVRGPDKAAPGSAPILDQCFHLPDSLGTGQSTQWGAWT